MIPRSPPTECAPTATNRVAARLRNGSLLARSDRELNSGIKHKLPKTVPTAFLLDVCTHYKMIANGGTACSIHGIEHQEDMAAWWPTEWMLWMFHEVGSWTYYNEADERKRMKQADNPFRRRQ